MISKAFQNIVTQMADVFPKKFGIVDSHGLVLANNGGEPTGDIIENLVYAATNNDKLLFKDGYTVRSMSNKPYAEYVVYVEGTDEVSKYCCNSIVVAANNVRHYYDEKYEKNDCTGLRGHDDRIYGDHRMRQGGWTDKGGDKNDSR